MSSMNTSQNTLKHPLNDILGKPANVKILRVLFEETVGPVRTAEVAEKSGVTVAGARRALNRLARTGVIELLGSSYMVRRDSQFVEFLSLLFHQEANRYRELISAIKKQVSHLLEVKVLWIDQAPIEFGEPLNLGIVGEGRALSYLGKEIQSRLTRLESEYDVIIEIRTFSESEAEAFEISEDSVIYGYIAGRDQQQPLDHNSHDERSARASSVIARLVAKNPSLIRRSIQYLDYQLAEDQGTATYDLKEWREILTSYSVQRVKDFLVSRSSRANRLRQSSPFFAVLQSDEREEVYREIEAPQ